MRKLGLALGCAVLLGMASTSWAVVGVVFSEDFEGFNTTGDMLVDWGSVVNKGELDTTLGSDGLGGSAGQSAFHPGSDGAGTGTINIHDLGLAQPLIPTATEWIRLSVDIFDDDTSLDPLFPLNPDNKRMSLGLRSGAPAGNLIELGMWNGPTHFAYRAILFDSINGTPNPNWQAWDLGTEILDIGGVPTEFPINRFLGPIWNRYTVTITPDSIIFDFDLNADGTIDATVTHNDIPTSALGFTELRFGGPSGVTSLGGGVHFDNILLEIIDAPVLIAGDLDGSGLVDIIDLNIVLSQWDTDGSGDPRADTDGNGLVDIIDLNVVLTDWDMGAPPAAGAAVPEPATLGLVALGGLAMLRRRR